MTNRRTTLNQLPLFCKMFRSRILTMVNIARVWYMALNSFQKRDQIELKLNAILSLTHSFLHAICTQPEPDTFDVVRNCTNIHAVVF